ncbi:MAG: response regulator [Anaerolineales bacterium]|nr:response regulator [Anaerolineales bacterium]
MKGELLLIEDSHNTQMIVKKILELQGYSLQTASDGISGLRKIEELTPKVVLLDISLPQMDGMEVARKVRFHENETVQNTVLIALTAMAASGDRERFFDVGCDDYLPKPFRSAQLVDIVQKYMSADYIPGESVNPGMLRRKKVAEMEAYQTRIAEQQAAEKEGTAEQGQATQEPPKPKPAPRKQGASPVEPISGRKASLKIGGDFLSELLDPELVEPVDPIRDDE